MQENYFLFFLGLFIFIVGIISFWKSELFTKNAPKVHPYFYIDSTKYVKIRAVVMIILGSLLTLLTLLSILNNY